jgi:hypothetical protein
MDYCVVVNFQAVLAGVACGLFMRAYRRSLLQVDMVADEKYGQI